MKRTVQLSENPLTHSVTFQEAKCRWKNIQTGSNSNENQILELSFNELQVQYRSKCMKIHFMSHYVKKLNEGGKL